MRNEITSLKAEISSLKAWVRNLKLWAKTGFMAFSLFTLMMLGSLYMYTSRVESLSAEIRGLYHDEHCIKKQ